MVDGSEIPSPSSSVDTGVIVHFIVPGVPRSPTSRSRETWKAHVRGAAIQEWGTQPPIASDVSVVLVHFFKEGILDVDNMIKPILDALTGIIFVDDRQVIQVVARRTELVTGRQIVNASPDVVAAIERDADFVYVRVASAPDPGVMP